jgi:hypothetical protein
MHIFSNFFLKIAFEEILVLCFHCNIGYANAPHCYVMRLFICYFRLQIHSFLKDLLASITDVALNPGKKSRDTFVKGKGC